MFMMLLLAGMRVGASESDTFEQANKLYEEGRYLDAIGGYQALLTNHASAAVHFNLGNAYFKSGQIGEAIVHYRLAEQLVPRDPDVLANLRFTREHVDGLSYEAGWLERKAQTLTPGEWATLSTIAVWLLFALLIVRQLQPKWRSGLRPWTFMAGGLAVLLLTCAFWISESSAAMRTAVVTQAEAVMRLGPFEESQSALTLKNGAELRILDGKDEWFQVTAGNKQTGWVQTNRVMEVCQ